jgi:hypothetical protein
MNTSARDLRILSGLNKHSFSRLSGYIPRLSDRELTVLTNCLGCLIERRYLRHFSNHEIQHLKRILSPFRNYITSAATYKSSPAKRAKAFREIRTQTGRGIILSTLIAAAVPLITSLISNLGKKK